MRKAIGLLVSLALLALIWWQVDVDAILAATAQADPRWLAAGLLTIVPLTLVTAQRLRMLSRTPLSLGSATRLILSASTLNLILPSKMGDIAKGVALTGRHGFGTKLAVALVVMERSLDMAALLFWGVLALLWVGLDEPLYLLAALAVAALFALLLVLLSPGRAADCLVRTPRAGKGGPLDLRFCRRVAGGDAVAMGRAGAGAEGRGRVAGHLGRPSRPILAVRPGARAGAVPR